MTEHAAVIFVFFFLAEYASIVLICTLISILFLGGYLFSSGIMFFVLFDVIDSIQFLDFYLYISVFLTVIDFFDTLNDPMIEGILYGLILGLKTCIMFFVFV
jgi:NADH-ubiquinone oxidoreductase chain 1